MYLTTYVLLNCKLHGAHSQNSITTRTRDNRDRDDHINDQRQRSTTRTTINIINDAGCPSSLSPPALLGVGRPRRASQGFRRILRLGRASVVLLFCPPPPALGPRWRRPSAVRDVDVAASASDILHVAQGKLRLRPLGASLSRRGGRRRRRRRGRVGHPPSARGVERPVRRPVRGSDPRRAGVRFRRGHRLHRDHGEREGVCRRYDSSPCTSVAECHEVRLRGF